MRARRRSSALALALALLSVPCLALDKQGSAHGGDVSAGDPDAFDVSGAVTFGSALYNPAYAARPDNTGKALFRYALHADVDLLGEKLSLPVDLNMFTDSERKGALIFGPTEFDVISGLSSTWDLRPGISVEGGSRVEHDRPVDRAGATQTYVDARARLLYSLAEAWAPTGRKPLGDADISGWFTLGVFAYNPSYFARPNNSGRALLRYNPHVELSLFSDLLSFGLDATMFTDRYTSYFRPSELDFTPEVILHKGNVEVHVAYERDMPIDGLGEGLVQHWVYALLVYNFDLVNQSQKPLEQRGYVVSP